MKFKFVDKERELVYTLGDVQAMRKQFEGKEFDLNNVQEVVWMGIRRGDLTVQSADVPNLIDMATFPELMAAIRTATGLERDKRPTHADPAILSPSPATTSDAAPKKHGHSHQKISGDSTIGGNVNSNAKTTEPALSPAS